MYNRDTNHRRSIRLPGYDYSRAGAYFVTVCVQQRECLFGDIGQGEMQANEPGRMVEAAWNGLADHFQGIQTPAFALMPNHIHGIIVLVDTDGRRPAIRIGGHEGPSGHPVGAATEGRPEAATDARPHRRLSLADVVHGFKSWTTTKYRRGVYDHGWQPFAGRLWQRNYYERVIRNEEELMTIHQYILDNPARWSRGRGESHQAGDGAAVGATLCGRPG